MPARDYYLKGKGLCQREQTLCNVNSAPHTHTVAPVWRAERGRAPGGGWLREALPEREMSEAAKGRA